MRDEKDNLADKLRGINPEALITVGPSVNGRFDVGIFHNSETPGDVMASTYSLIHYRMWQEGYSLVGEVKTNYSREFHFSERNR